jgi:hypothetical protein
MTRAKNAPRGYMYLGARTKQLERRTATGSKDGTVDKSTWNKGH